MKFFAMIAMLCTAVAMTAAETALWEGDTAAIRVGKTVTTTVDNGVMTFVGKANPVGGKYGYVWPQVKIAPTVFKGKKLSFSVEPATSYAGDTIYIKGLAAGKTLDKNNKMVDKIVFSYMARQVSAKKNTYVLTIGENTGAFEWLPAQVNTPADTPVIRLDLIMGRNADGSEMKVSFSDIKLID